MKRFVVLVLIITLLFALFAPVASADPFGLMELSSIAYAMQSSFGFSFIPENATASGLTNILSNQLTDYINESGGSISSLFGSEAARLVAGKLVVGQQLVNGVIGFTNWLIDKFGLDEAAAKISKGFIGDIEIDEQKQFDESGSIAQTGYDVTFSGTPPYAQYGRTGYHNATVYLNGESIGQVNCGPSSYYTGQWYIGDGTNENYWYVCIPYWSIVNAYHPERDEFIIPGNLKRLEYKWDYDLTNVLTAEIDPDASIPGAIDPGWSWQGEMDGWTGPDTNIEDFYEEMLDHIIAEDINIQGEIVEDQPIPPEPTPAPIDPDTPLQDVPWEGLNDLLDLTNGSLESIDEALSGVNSGIDTISGQLDDVNEQIGEQTDAITESIEGVQDGISDLTDVVTEAFAAPEIDEKTFDLRELFPFCIPFDIYHLLQKFDGSPVAPHVQLPIVIPSIGFSYTLDLDFSAWDPVATAMRTVELIVYALGLAWATSKVIKW